MSFWKTHTSYRTAHPTITLWIPPLIPLIMFVVLGIGTLVGSVALQQSQDIRRGATLSCDGSTQATCTQTAGCSWTSRQEEQSHACSGGTESQCTRHDECSWDAETRNCSWSTGCDQSGCTQVPERYGCRGTDNRCNGKGNEDACNNAPAQYECEWVRVANGSCTGSYTTDGGTCSGTYTTTRTVWSCTGTPTPPVSPSPPPASTPPPTLLADGAVCTQNAQCQSNLCALTPYGRFCGQGQTQCSATQQKCEVDGASSFVFTCDQNGFWVKGQRCDGGCNGNVCQENVCTPNQTQCDGSNKKTCTSDGTAWQTESCPHGCSNGTCNDVPPLPSPSPSPTPSPSPSPSASPSLLTDGAVCTQNAQCQSNLCALTPYGRFCGQGQAQCTPDAVQCVDNAEQVCDRNGFWSPGKQCGALQCNSTTNRCNSASCTPNQTQCNGDTKQTCSSDGTYWQTESCPYGCYEERGVCNAPPVVKKQDGETCSSASDCAGGYCLFVPGARVCASTASLGSPGAEGESCGTNAYDQACASGLMCQNNICAPVVSCAGQPPTCQGNVLMTCLADGKTTSGTVCPYGCEGTACLPAPTPTPLPLSLDPGSITYTIPTTDYLTQTPGLTGGATGSTYVFCGEDPACLAAYQGRTCQTQEQCNQLNTDLLKLTGGLFAGSLLAPVSAAITTAAVGAGATSVTGVANYAAISTQVALQTAPTWIQAGVTYGTAGLSALNIYQAGQACKQDPSSTECAAAMSGGFIMGQFADDFSNINTVRQRAQYYVGAAAKEGVTVGFQKTATVNWNPGQLQATQNSIGGWYNPGTKQIVIADTLLNRINTAMGANDDLLLHEGGHALRSLSGETSRVYDYASFVAGSNTVQSQNIGAAMEEIGNMTTHTIPVLEQSKSIVALAAERKYLQRWTNIYFENLSDAQRYSKLNPNPSIQSVASETSPAGPFGIYTQNNGVRTFTSMQEDGSLLTNTLSPDNLNYNPQVLIPGQKNIDYKQNVLMVGQKKVDPYASILTLDGTSIYADPLLNLPFVPTQ